MPSKLNLNTNVLNSLIDSNGGPIYIYDEVKIIERAKYFMDTFKRYIPNFKQYFAVKATPNIHILDLLHTEGMDFDCSSLTEVELVGKLKKPTEIMYTSNYTSVDDYEELLCSIHEGVIRCNHDLPIKITLNLDDVDCLENLVIASHNVNLPLPEIISFRLNPLIGSTNSETNSNVLGGPNTKFGIPIENIVNAYETAIKYGFKKFGIHVMVGSCVSEISHFINLIDVVFNVINNIYSKLGITFDFVNLGGGIGIPYKPNQSEINLNELAYEMSKRINHNLDKYNLPFDPVIAMENGRYITGQFGWLVTRCESIKYGYLGKKFCGLNASMANLMRPGMYGAYHHIYVPRLDNDPIQKNMREIVNVVGTLCENNDWFATNRDLPVNIKKNDIFVICDVGAHGFSMGFQYNGKLRSAELLYNSKDNTIKLIREKETMVFF